MIKLSGCLLDIRIRLIILSSWYPYRPLYRAVYSRNAGGFRPQFFLIAHYIGLSTPLEYLDDIANYGTYRPLYRAVYNNI